MSVSSIHSHKIPTVWSASEGGESPEKDQHSRFHSIDRKYIFLYVEFEVRFRVSFTRECMSSKKWHFFIGNGPSFLFWRRGLKPAHTQFSLGRAELGSPTVFRSWLLLLHVHHPICEMHSRGHLRQHLESAEY